MDLISNVKLGEITNLSDARFAAGRGAHFIGFNFTPNHLQYLAPEKAAEIIGWVDGPKLVGEWDGGISFTISDTAERLQLEYIQLNNFDAELSKDLQDWNLIQNLNLENSINEIAEQVDKTQAYTQIYLLSYPDIKVQNNCLEKDSTLQMISSLCRDFPVLLNFHFTQENLLPLLKTFVPLGINLKGSNEIKPGYKDFDELNDLIDLLEE